MSTARLCGYLYQGEIYHQEVIDGVNAQPIYADSVIGKRMQERTLHFLFIAVMHELYPHIHVRIEHSFSHGVYVKLNTLEDVCVDNIIQKMQYYISQKQPIQKVKDFQFELLGVVLEFYDEVCTHCGDLSFQLKPFQQGLWLALEGELQASNKLFSVLREFEEWEKLQGVTSLQDLNQCTLNQQLNDLVLISEAMAERKLMEVCDQIVAQQKRFVLISGPSSAGKTTTSKRLALHLKVLGKKVLTIAMDDFYKNREDTPKKADGSYDFECVEALDLPYFKQVLEDMLMKKPVKLPIFDFKSGTRKFHDEAYVMDERAIIIIEGIHGLNPIMKQFLNMDQAYRLYINALTHLNIDDHNYLMTNDYRLIRRIARNQKTRGRNAEEIILARESVAEGEYLYIYPYQEESDCIMNTSLMYELAILKKEVEHSLKAVSEQSEAAYDAKRLLRILEHVQAGDASCIPRNSVLQEFLVNSIFEETSI